MKTLQIRLPEGLRDEADAVLADMGLDLPTAVRLYLTKIVQTRSIPFALEAPTMRVESIQVDEEIQADMNSIATAWKRRRP
jgi:DNA-damage-inducible protein J